MTILFAIIANCMMGGAFAAVTGTDTVTCMATANIIATLAGPLMPKGVAMGSVSPSTGVLTEIWTGELVKKLNAGLNGSWLDGIPDNSSIVNNNVIHLVDCGVDPEVLINNTTYPIDLQALDDSDIAIQLDKFQTKVTPITDDELYAISYDKMQRVKEAHGNAITEAKFKKAAHAMAIEDHQISTTGDFENGTSGRRRITRDDIISLKQNFDKMGTPTQGRRLVLCPDHVNDLLLLDQKFADQYYNYQTGKISNLYGFEVYEYANCPIFTQSGVKKALDATASTGEYQVSFAFLTDRVFKATGSTKMYYSEASTDPEYQRNKINFTHRFIAMPKKEDAFGVIMSAYEG